MTDELGLAKELLDLQVTVATLPESPADTRTTVGKMLKTINEYLAAGNIQKAEHLLRQLWQSAPTATPIGILLARLYADQGQMQLALTLLDEVLANEPQNLAALIAKAFVLNRQGRAREAVTVAERIFELTPENPDNLNNLGVYRMACGDFSGAGDAYAAAIKLRPNFISAYHNLMGLPEQTLDESQLATLERLANEAMLPENERAIAALCISRHHRSQNEPAREFIYLHRAKASLARQSPWNADEFTQLVEEIIALDAKSLEKFIRPRQTRLTPIFVCSMPRAGSTLIEQLIATHPAVTSIGEAGLATKVVQATLAAHGLDEPNWWRWLNRPDAQQIMATVRLSFDRTLAGYVPTTEYVCEKSINNDLMLGLCLLAFPNAQVIHCQREPLDVCLSAYQAHLPQLQFTNNLQWLATRYQLHMRLMNHWRQLFPGRIHTVKYETLVADTHTEIARLVAALGLPESAGGMDLQQRNYTVNSASNWQVRQPIYQTSRHRWRKYADQLQDIMHLAQISADVTTDS